MPHSQDNRDVLTAPRSRNRLTCYTRLAAAIAVAVLVAAGPPRGLAARGDCSQPVSDGASPVATDCLAILQTAVATNNCNGLDPCVCAPAGSLPVSATDALVCLQVATAQGGALSCPCGFGGTSSSSSTSSLTTLSTTTTTATTTTTLAAGGASAARTDESVSTKVNGECTTGPERMFCDGALRASGEPFISCNTDLDCRATDCGIAPCGNCTLLLPGACLAPTITAGASGRRP